MKIVLAGYRSWATKAFDAVKLIFPEVSFSIASSPEELSKVHDSVILGAGWSWILDDSFIDRNEIIALVHPSDLPEYAGGTPLQHQIIAGIVNTKATLFEVTNKLDAGPILYKSDLSLEGNMIDIFSSLSDVTVDLFSRFIKDYPNIPKEIQKPKKIYKRLKPEDSNLSGLINEMSSLEIYNHIRCREHPYPNAYIKDDTGTLYFKQVTFIEGENNDKFRI